MDERSKELCVKLKEMTGLNVTAKLDDINHKGLRYFEFSNGKRMIATVFTYQKAKRWADGFAKGRRYERETRAHRVPNSKEIQAYVADGGKDVYRWYASRCYHVPEDDVTEAQRLTAKKMAFVELYRASHTGDCSHD